ncbi:hypothetical protein C1645_773920 [Glomus cerebriforme]|uniref:HMG box domain-containing protein n=1 Tax=Glomus cerebriforme TaxID=658196 RepID=A0A397T0Y8_9GLOM|nr:hypothetical protein C1645_773920 [Glomus cerebriforme]
MNFGISKVAEKICTKYKYSKQHKMTISRQLMAIIWKEIPNETEIYFGDLAKEVDKLHKEKYPEYKLVKNKKQKDKITFKHYNINKKPHVNNKTPSYISSKDEDENQDDVSELFDNIIPGYEPNYTTQEINNAPSIMKTSIPARLSISHETDPILSIPPRSNLSTHQTQTPSLLNSEFGPTLPIFNYNTQTSTCLPTFEEPPALSCTDRLSNMEKYNEIIFTYDNNNFADFDFNSFN